MAWHQVGSQPLSDRISDTPSSSSDHSGVWSANNTLYRGPLDSALSPYTANQPPSAPIEISSLGFIIVGEVAI